MLARYQRELDRNPKSKTMRALVKNIEDQIKFLEIIRK